jgi:hypothetical protein
MPCHVLHILINGSILLIENRETSDDKTMTFGWQLPSKIYAHHGFRIEVL